MVLFRILKAYISFVKKAAFSPKEAISDVIEFEKMDYVIFYSLLFLTMGLFNSLVVYLLLPGVLPFPFFPYDAYILNVIISVLGTLLLAIVFFLDIFIFYILLKIFLRRYNFYDVLRVETIRLTPMALYFIIMLLILLPSLIMSIFIKSGIFVVINTVLLSVIGFIVAIWSFIVYILALHYYFGEDFIKAFLISVIGVPLIIALIATVATNFIIVAIQGFVATPALLI